MIGSTNPVSAQSFEDRVVALMDYKHPNYGMRLELIVQRLYEAVLKPGDCAIDGGCNVGHHTFPMARSVGERGPVKAIEAQELPLNELRRQIGELGFKNITLVHGALSKVAGSMEFTGIVGETGWGGLKETPWTPKHLERKIVRVDAYTLNGLAANLDRVRFVKLDLEGGDFDALQGGRSMIAKHGCGIAFENAGQNGANLYNYTYAQFAELFNSLQYTCYDIFGRKMTEELWMSIGYHCPPEAFAAPTGSEIEKVMIAAADAAMSEALR